jgi:hypothetical protein
VNAGFFIFPTDILDEGPEQLLRRLVDAGIGRIALACSYHHARDLFPHNPRRVVYYHEGNVLFFHPEPSRYSGLTLKPRISRLARSVDILATTLEHATRHNMGVYAWLILLHDIDVEEKNVHLTIRNAFGDRHITQLCPANPEVQAFATAIVEDLSRYSLEAILAESVGYHGFNHGYHHERCFVPLTPLARFLLGICFCEHCTAAAENQRIDAERLRFQVRAALQAALAEQPPTWLSAPLSWNTISSLFDGELSRYLLTQQYTVTNFIARIQRAIHHTTNGRTSLIPIDLSGATLGYMTGVPSEDVLAAEIAWQEGLSLERVASITRHLAILGYVREPSRLLQDLEAYFAKVPPDTALTVILRPLWPDCLSQENLFEKIRIIRDKGIDDILFYHYGLMPINRLAWIQNALKIV